MTRRYYSSTAQRTTLASALSSGATTMLVSSTSGFPGTRPYTLVVDPDTINEEIVTVTAASGTTLTVTRGEDGTAAVAHDLGAVVWHGMTGRDLGEPQAHMDADDSVHGVTGNVVGTSDTQTLTGKSMSGADNTFSNIPQSAVTNLTTDLASKAPIASPTFTGNPVLPATTVVGDVDAAELQRLNGVTSNVQAQLDAKAPIVDPSFSGTVDLPGDTSIGLVTAAEIARLAGVTSNIQAQLDAILGGGASVPTGGATGDILVKRSADDYDMEWRSAASLVYIPGAGGNVIVTDGSVTGGDTVGTYTEGSVTYKYHKFTTTGSTLQLVNTEPFIGQLLVVGGAGGGGGQSGGFGNGYGGGGGTVWFGDYAFGIHPNGVDEGVHNVTIGDGSAAQPYAGTGVQADDTRFDDIICYGGGGGAPETGSPSDGGSGGKPTGLKLGGSLDGGTSSTTDSALGFLCEDGADGGGDGFTINLTGSSVTYGAGGPDGNNSGGGAAVSPAANTGSGGGGANGGGGSGADGADGVVIVRYRIA